MLKEHDRLYRNLLVAFDVVLIVAGLCISYYLRVFLTHLTGEQTFGRLYPIRVYFKLVPFVTLMWIASLYVCGAYDVFRGKGARSILASIVKAGLLVGIVFTMVAFSFQFYFVSRSFFALILMICGMLITAERFALLKILNAIRTRGYNFKYMLVVGTGRRAHEFIKTVHRHPEWGFKIIGLVDADPAKKDEEILGHRVLGSLQDLPQLLDRYVIDNCVFVVPRSWLYDIEDSILYCEQVGVKVSVALDHYNLKFAKAKQSNLASFPLLTFETTSDKIAQLFCKRVVDLVGSFTALVTFSPLFALLAVLIKIDSRGPVFFKQTRSGLNGRKFTLYKFRTMVVDAEERLQELRAKNQMEGPVFKLDNDPRMTPLGKWLRKFSLDELPQLWNVLRGDMSLVGPRPPLPSEVNEYQPWQRRRLSMPPGITCIWQVNGRSDVVDFDDWMKMDLQYIDNWSFLLDMKICLQTVPAVLLAKGAR